MRSGAEKFVGVNTVNCYPESAEAPMKESSIWEGLPEKNVAAYGLSKRLMLFASDAYRRQYGYNSINPVLDNVYGPFDVFDPGRSRVIPAMIYKCIEAREEDIGEVSFWGSGKPLRSFLYVDDAVRGIMLAAEKYDKSEPVNICSGPGTTIKALASLIARLTGFSGDILWDAAKADGQMRRGLDGSRAKEEFGFTAEVSLEAGLKETISWYEKEGKQKGL
jgi:GDP-L-fucose synthase